MSRTYDSKERFGDRVADYVRYRPGYPRQIIELLRERIGLCPTWDVADVGAGTGLSAKPFLANGNRVFAVEPNVEMAAAAGAYLAGWSDFHLVSGSAESTGLGDAVVDVIVVGQAFHWFRPQQAAREFRRILKPGGWCVLMWNDRRTSGTAFLVEYEELLRQWGTDYHEVSSKHADPAAMRLLFGHSRFEEAIFESSQEFDFAGLRGRLLSSSYTPAASDPNRTAMLVHLKEIFDRNQQRDSVQFVYDTKVFWAKLKP